MPNEADAIGEEASLEISSDDLLGKERLEYHHSESEDDANHQNEEDDGEFRCIDIPAVLVIVRRSQLRSTQNTYDFIGDSSLFTQHLEVVLMISVIDLL